MNKLINRKITFYDAAFTGSLTKDERTYFNFAEYVLAEAKQMLAADGIIAELKVLCVTLVKTQESNAELFDLHVDFSLCDEPICYGGSTMHFGKMSIDDCTQENKVRLASGIVKSIKYWARSHKQIRKELYMAEDGSLRWVFV